ncbi:MAG TPA: hypothetical protein VFL55_15425 [Acetobacteraceae bacterium]|nr:hypothetical protein [Acetobacteraceae bacterium]
MRLSRLAALCLLLLPFSAVRADDLGPTQAEALQKQLNDWLAGLLGPGAALRDLPWRVTGEHDHYAISWPIPGLTVPNSEPAIRADVRPLDGGRWSIERLTLPPAGSFTVTVPDPDTGGSRAPVDFHYTIDRQDSHGVIDPSLTGVSTTHTELSGIALASDSADQRREQRIDRYVAESSVVPLHNDRLDLTSIVAATGWKTATQLGNGTPVAVGIEAIHATGRVNGIRRDRAAGLLAAAAGLISALPPDFMAQDDKTDLPPAARTQLRLLVDSLQDLLTAVSIEETVDGLQAEIAGVGGFSLKRFLLGFGGEAPDGRLHAWLHIGLDELATPSLPPRVATLLPHRVELKPSLSGVLTSDLQKLAVDATEDGANASSLEPDITAIFAHGGVKLALDTLAFDIGPAKVEGSGQVTALSPDTWHGEAHVTATGLDDLASLARTNPDLKEALPALIMLRGLGKPDGKKLVWDIVSDGPSVQVNGLDLSQLGGGDAPKPPPGKPGQKPRR